MGEGSGSVTLHYYLKSSDSWHQGKVCRDHQGYNRERELVIFKSECHKNVDISSKNRHPVGRNG